MFDFLKKYRWRKIAVRLLLILINVFELVLTFVPSKKVTLKTWIDKLENYLNDIEPKDWY